MKQGSNKARVCHVFPSFCTNRLLTVTLYVGVFSTPFNRTNREGRDMT